jgi:hypothetical protein
MSQQERSALYEQFELEDDLAEMVAMDKETSK